MKYIFMDESGDLGFDLDKKGTSRYFSMTFLITENIKTFDKTVKKTFRGFTSKKVKRLGGVLHAHKLDHKERIKMFKKIHETSFSMYSIIIDKRDFYIQSYRNTQYLYATIANKLFDYLQGMSKVTFVASRRYTNKDQTRQFKELLVDNIHPDIHISINIAPSSTHKGLQIADACSRAIHRKYEFGDTTWYSYICKKIVGEYQLFK